MTNPSSICVLVSGGLDSAMLVKRGLALGHLVYPLYVASGFQWERAERHCLNQQLQYLSNPKLKALKVLSYPAKEFFSDHWGFHPQAVPDQNAPPNSGYIPARNLMLLTQATLYSAAEDLSEIWLGTLAGHSFPDTTRSFFSGFEKIIFQSIGKKIKIEAPFIQLEKWELMAQNPDFPFELAFSCLNPQGNLACHQCRKCEESRSHLERARRSLADAPL